MKVGLIARAEDRGLGHMTWEFARAVRPERTIIVAMGDLARGFKAYPERYTNLGGEVDVVGYGEMGGAGRELMAMLRNVDVVYSAETFYDWRFCALAAEHGVATVCHAMPEFYNHWHDPSLTPPTRWWIPTPWHADRFPAGTEMRTVPVPLDRWPEPVPHNADDRLRVLHVAGHRAALDRNGTGAVLSALRHVRQRVVVTIVGQDGRLPAATGVPSNVELRMVPNGVADYWRLYEGHDALVLPRRYGGLCLPVQQAAGAGLAIGLPNVSPNEWYPASLFACDREADRMRCALGDMAVATSNARDVATLIDEWARDRDALRAAQQRARAWAVENAWTPERVVAERDALRAATISG